MGLWLVGKKSKEKKVSSSFKISSFSKYLNSKLNCKENDINKNFFLIASNGTHLEIL